MTLYIYFRTDNVNSSMVASEPTVSAAPMVLLDEYTNKILVDGYYYVKLVDPVTKLPVNVRLYELTKSKVEDCLCVIAEYHDPDGDATRWARDVLVACTGSWLTTRGWRKLVVRQFTNYISNANQLDLLDNIAKSGALVRTVNECIL
jgi:hypothetical protein